MERKQLTWGRSPTDELIGNALEIITMHIGRLAVWLFSLGRWRADPLFEDERRTFGAAGALSFVRDGRRVITKTGLLFAGIAFLVFTIAVAMVIAFGT